MLCVLCMLAQPASPAPESARPVLLDEIVVVIDGIEYTAREVEMIRNALPPQFREQTQQMDHGNFLTVYGELLGFAKLAEKEGIPEKEPYKSQIAFARMNFLAQVYLMRLTSLLEVTDEDVLDYYKTHTSEFEELKVSAIYIDFVTPEIPLSISDNDKPNESEALEKATGIVASLRAGANFAELAKKHSDDNSSKSKGGDMGFFTRDSSVPQTIKNAIFQLDQSEISDPIKDGRRFYILTVTEKRSKSLEAAKNVLNEKVRGIKLKRAINDIRRTISIERKNEQFLKQIPKAPPPAKTVSLPVIPE